MLQQGRECYRPERYGQISDPEPCPDLDLEAAGLFGRVTQTWKATTRGTANPPGHADLQQSMSEVLLPRGRVSG